MTTQERLDAIRSVLWDDDAKDWRDLSSCADAVQDITLALSGPSSPTLVYVLFHETNTGHSEGSDGYVEAVYATEALAEAAKLAAIRALVADGQDVYWNPDAPEGEQEGPPDWTDDFDVLAMQVIDAAEAQS